MCGCVPLRNTGGAISPFNAFLILQGIETLGLRLERINDNTLKVAQYLQQHAKVAWVNYAACPIIPTTRWPSSTWAARRRAC